MGKIFERILDVNLPNEKSAFLWGPRKVGKSFWLNRNFPNAVLIDFLKTDIYIEYISKPYLLRERYSDCKDVIIIDEVQMVPQLLDEVHWLIANKKIRFILTGSSPRKLRKNHANLLGGRAWRYVMMPLCYLEIKEEFNLEDALVTGFIPDHFTSSNIMMEMRSYIADYLKEEIVSWEVTNNIPKFSEFLKVASITNGELLNYTNVARESGVSAKIVRNYFTILEDTLLGYRLSPWSKVKKRRLIEADKFYFFDVGVANYLAGRKPAFGTPEFGKSFEHYILMELKAYQAYRNPEMDIYYWRTSSGLEVDFILGNMEVAIEIKSSKRVHETDTKSLKILAEENNVKKLILVSFEKESKKLPGDIQCVFWQDFLELLWNGDVI